MATITLRNGKYQAKVRIKGHSSKTKTLRTKQMAKAWARKIEDQINSGTLADSTASAYRLKDLFDKYSTLMTPRKGSSTQELSRIKLLKEYFGNIYAHELTPEAVIQYVDHRLDTVKIATVRKDINTLSTILDTALAMWNLKLPVNPVQVAKTILKVTKTLSGSDARDRRVSAEEEKELLGQAGQSESQMHDIIYVALSTGMRRGELLRIKSEHINKEKLTLFIPFTKTGVARTIPITLKTMQLLVKNVSDTSPYVFTLKPDSVTHGFIRVALRAKCEDLQNPDPY